MRWPCPGRRDDAEAIRLDLTAEAGERFVAPFLFGLIASGLGQKDVALDWLEKVRASKSGWIPFLPVELAFAWLRGDPRFKQLLTGIKR